jgi:hypothetical protein
LEQTAYLHPETPKLQEVFPTKNKSQFSQGSNVLDATASYTDGFILRITCSSSSQLKRPILKKESLSTL